MHPENVIVWEYISRSYPSWFSGNHIRVLEAGSLYINGSIRDVFGPVGEYIGVDWRAGENVDFASLVHNLPDSMGRFDTVVSASMLEHDPHWEQSITRMVSLLKPEGLLALTWGNCGNTPHCLKSAPDGKFHPLDTDLVHNLIEHLGVSILEEWEEIDLVNNVAPHGAQPNGTSVDSGSSVVIAGGATAL